MKKPSPLLSDQAAFVSLLQTTKGWLAMGPQLAKHLILGAYYNIRAFIQRGRRGYSDEDAFGWCDYLATIMPGVIEGIKNGPGVPTEFIDMPDPKKAWNEVLDIMADGFAAHLELNKYYFGPFDKAAAIRERRDRGLALFAKYYGDLWS